MENRVLLLLLGLTEALGFLWAMIHVKAFQLRKLNAASRYATNMVSTHIQIC